MTTARRARCPPRTETENDMTQTHTPGPDADKPAAPDGSDEPPQNFPEAEPGRPDPGKANPGEAEPGSEEAGRD